MNGVIKTNTVLDKFIENNRLILERSRRKKLRQLEKETCILKTRVSRYSVSGPAARVSQTSFQNARDKSQLCPYSRCHSLDETQFGILPSRHPNIDDITRNSSKNRNYLFSSRILAKMEKREIALIAEIKKTSLSKQVLNPDINIVRQAKAYEESRAAAISVITQPLHFSGLLDDLKEVSKAVKIPTLRKEFIFDPYQIYETKLAGASAVLLITMLLEKSLLRELLAMTFSIGLDALVEIHDEQELEKALSCNSKIIGVNARDLTTFKVDISTVERLLPQIPEEIIKVAESGIKSADEVKRVRDAGADAILVGTSIMESKDPSEKIRELQDVYY